CLCSCFGWTTRCVTARATGSTTTRAISPQAPSVQLAAVPIEYHVSAIVASSSPPTLGGSARPQQRHSPPAPAHPENQTRPPEEPARTETQPYKHSTSREPR